MGYKGMPQLGFWPALALIQELHYDLSYRLKLNIRHSQCGRSGPGTAHFGLEYWSVGEMECCIPELRVKKLEHCDCGIRTADFGLEGKMNVEH